MPDPTSARSTGAGDLVLLVTGPAIGGIRGHVRTLARLLPGSGWRVIAAGPEEPIEECEHVALDLTDRIRPLRDAKALLRLRALIAERRPAIVHAHGARAALFCAASAPPARLLITAHNIWRGGPLTIPLAMALRRAVAVTSVSEAAARSLPIRSGVDVIPNGVSLDRFPASPLPGSRTVLFAGRLTEEKGVHLLLRAAPLIRRANVRLLVVGEGPLEREVAEAGHRGDLEWRGSVDDVGPFYRECDAVVVPSLAEGQSLVALEAMASARPVVAAAVGGLLEVVRDGETGILAPPGDPAALAAAAIRLLDAPERAAEMGLAGRRRVEDAYKEEAMIARLTALYERAGSFT